MRRCLLLATGAIASSLLACPVDPSLAESDKSGAAAAAAGCSIDPDLPFAATLGPWPGAKESPRRIVATSSDPHEGEDLGELCVGVVRSVGSAFTKVATLNAPGPRPPAEIRPLSNVHVAIDRVPFYYAPGQTAFAVRVTGELNTQTANATHTRLYLYRVNNDQINEIFEAKVEDRATDKVGETVQDETRIIEFSRHMTRGVFDLLLSNRSHLKSKRYIWTGARYSEA